VGVATKSANADMNGSAPRKKIIVVGNFPKFETPQRKSLSPSYVLLTDHSATLLVEIDDVAFLYDTTNNRYTLSMERENYKS